MLERFLARLLFHVLEFFFRKASDKAEELRQRHNENEYDEKLKERYMEATTKKEKLNAARDILNGL